LLQDALAGKFQAAPPLLFGNLLRGKLLLPRFHGGFRILLLLLDRFALPASGRELILGFQRLLGWCFENSRKRETRLS
jgi:hypothetical protein